MNAEKFAEFFGGVPIFIIPGRAFKVETDYTKVQNIYIYFFITGIYYMNEF